MTKELTSLVFLYKKIKFIFARFDEMRVKI